MSQWATADQVRIGSRYGYSDLLAEIFRVRILVFRSSAIGRSVIDDFAGGLARLQSVDLMIPLLDFDHHDPMRKELGICKGK